MADEKKVFKLSKKDYSNKKTQEQEMGEFIFTKNKFLWLLM